MAQTKAQRSAKKAAATRKRNSAKSSAKDVKSFRAQYREKPDRCS